MALQPVRGWSFMQSLYDIYCLIRKRIIRKAGDKMELLKKRAEIKYVKSPTHPHFIYNSLNTLLFLTATDADSARRFIDLFSGIYKYVLKSIELDWTNVQTEFDFIRIMFELQRIKSGYSIEIKIFVQHSRLRTHFIPPLSLQLLIENAIKHNAFSVSDPLFIYIRFG